MIAGEVLFQGQDLRGLTEEQMRRLRGNRIAMIFQDPLMTLNPVLRIEEQMLEAIQTHHPEVSRAAALQRCVQALEMVGIPAPHRACATSRTSSRAACASAWRLPLRCSTSPR